MKELLYFTGVVEMNSPLKASFGYWHGLIGRPLF